MKMRSSNYIKGCLAAVCGLLAGPLSAQETQNQQQQQVQTTTDSIAVVRDYRPMLADAVKIRRSPDMTNKREYQPKLNYRIIDKKLDISTGTKQLNIQEMRFDTPEDRPNNYVKIGAGNYGTYLGELYLSNDDYVDTRFGGYVKHLNQKGSLHQQKFSQQEIGVFGRQLYEPFTISGDLGYRRNGTYFYGQDLNSSPLFSNPDPAKQVFNDVNFSAELTSNASEVTNLLYSLKADGYAFRDSYNVRENSLALSGFLGTKVNDFNLGLHISGDITGLKGISNRANNNILRIEGSGEYETDRFKLKLSGGYVKDTDGFLNVHGEFAAVPEYLYLFGGYKSADILKTSLREITALNPWIGQNQVVKNTIEKNHFYFGVKGNAGATFSYKASLFHKNRVYDFSVFEHDILSRHKFNLEYENLKRLRGFEGELNIRISEAVSLGGQLQFLDYNTRLSYLPDLLLNLNTRVNISDKLYLNGELLFQERVKTKLPVGYIQEVDAFTDLNVGLEYRATKQLGIYIRANNLLGKEYERFAFYPRLGLNVIGGVNFSF